MLEGVLAGLIVAAILAAWRWLGTREHRESALGFLRARTCRHQWERIYQPGESVVVISADEEWCVKCNARR